MTMIRAVLFDLDNTLLGNDMNTFLPRYFDLCGDFAQQHLPRDVFMQSLLLASRMMVKNTDPAQTNEQVFWSSFGELTKLDTQQFALDFDRFYRNEFEQLQAVTQPRPNAARVIEACFQRNLKVVIATNPMFPRTAIEARLAWAGIPVDEHPYALVTTMENMHATKPNEVYYGEILDVIGCSPNDALMVGDDLENDIAPAAAMGLHTYWIQRPGVPLPDDLQPTAVGTLAELLARIEDGWLEIAASRA